MSHPTITLLTDFGTRDGYVAAMKGVILTEAPSAMVIDAGHDIPPHDIQAAAWALRQYGLLYPPGSLHVVVVDPGVGTDRAGIVGEFDGRRFIAPDNGVLHWASADARHTLFRAIREDVHRPGVKSSTFHGRDVFAYVAGRLASGGAFLDTLTEPILSVTMPPWGTARVDGSEITGEIVHVDRFGNLITNIRRADLGPATPLRRWIHAGRHDFDRLHLTYGAVPPGTPLALIGSHGHLELAVHGASAAEALGLGRGDSVQVRVE